jgi:hypothetical protein
MEEAVVEVGGPAPTRNEGATGVLTRDHAAAVTLAITTIMTLACAALLTGEAVAGGCHSEPSKIASKPVSCNYTSAWSLSCVMSSRFWHVKYAHKKQIRIIVAFVLFSRSQGIGRFQWIIAAKKEMQRTM